VASYAAQDRPEEAKAISHCITPIADI
jgi:hypothetical protein